MISHPSAAGTHAALWRRELRRRRYRRLLTSRPSLGLLFATGAAALVAFFFGVVAP